MRDLRLAHAAGDEAAYRCILYRRPDGKSPAEVAAECVACDAGLPAWAVWRDEQHRLQYEADERAVDAAEERNVWRFTRSDAMCTYGDGCNYGNYDDDFDDDLYYDDDF